MFQNASEKAVITELFDLLFETFEGNRGLYIDKGTSLIETLNTISATEASQSLSSNCSTIATLVSHITFYLEALERFMLKQDVSDVDWQSVWQGIATVDTEEWESRKKQLMDCYRRVERIIHEKTYENNGVVIIGALDILAHTAYHLGEIRQIFCAIHR